MFSLNYDTMRLVDELGEYVSALREAGYAISLCKLDSVFYAVFPPSADYLRHDFEYCAIVKKTRNEKCLERQNLLLENLSEWDCEFSACHAGVCEYVSPIVEGRREIRDRLPFGVSQRGRVGQGRRLRETLRRSSDGKARAGADKPRAENFVRNRSRGKGGFAERRKTRKDRARSHAVRCRKSRRAVHRRRRMRRRFLLAVVRSPRV